MGFFDDIGDAFKDAGDILTDIATFGGLSKKKAAKANASAMERAAFLNAEALRADADTVLEISRENRKRALLDADAVLRSGELNAAVFDADAEAVEVATRIQAGTFRLVSRREIGFQKASFGASGVRLQGSPLVLLSESERIAKTDIRNLFSLGRTRASRLLSQANITREEARIRYDRFVDQSDLILRQGDLEAERLRKQADITEETGQSQANVLRLQGKSLLFQGITQGVSTGISIASGFGVFDPRVSSSSEIIL